MLEGIYNGLKAGVEGILAIGEFIINIVKNQGKAIQILGKVATEAAELINEFPDYLQVFATITVLISIIYLFIGWNAGRSE